MSSCLSKFPARRRTRAHACCTVARFGLLRSAGFTGTEDAGLSFSTSVTVGLQNGDAFSLAGNSTVNTLQWWGTSADATGFVVRLFDSAAAAAPIFECGDSLGLSTCMGAVSGSATGLADSAGDGISAFSIDPCCAAVPGGPEPICWPSATNSRTGAGSPAQLATALVRIAPLMTRRGAKLP